MFIRTKRLFLRPPWPEDADVLAEAMGNLDHAPCSRAPTDARMLMFARTEAQPVLVGGIGFDRRSSPDPEIVCWVAPASQGQGYATEAGRAVLEIAFEGLRLPQLAARRHVDDRVSRRLLEKLGFEPTGAADHCFCMAHGGPVESVGYRLTRRAWRTAAAHTNLRHLFVKPSRQPNAMVAHA